MSFIQAQPNGGGGGGSPALPFGGIQYNNSGAFYADADFTRDPITHETFIGRDMANPGQQAGWLLQENVIFGAVPLVGNAWIDNTNNMQAWNGIIDTTAFGGQPGLPGMFKFAQSGDQAILLLNQNDPTGGFQWQMYVDNSNYNNTQANVGVNDNNATLQFSDNNTNYSGRFRVRGSGADITYGTSGNSVGMFFNAGDMGWSYNSRKFHLPSGVPTVGQVLGVTNVSLPNVTLDWVNASGSSLTGYTTSVNTGLGIGTAPDTLGYANTLIGNSAGTALDPLAPSADTSRNTIIGAFAATQLLNGYDNFIGGYQALLAHTDTITTSVIIAPDSSMPNSGQVDGAVALGVGSISAGLGNNAVSIGIGASASGGYSVAIGEYSHADNYSVALGSYASSGGNNGSIALGRGATNTNSYQFVVGSNSGPITDMYLGYGVQNSIPIDVKIHGSEIQTGTADTAGGNMYLIPSIGTGTGQGGTLYVRSSLAGASGSTPNTPYSWAQFGPGLSILGDIDGVIGNTQLITDAANQVVRINGLGGVSGDNIARFDNASRIVTLGDVDRDYFQTQIVIEDQNKINNLIAANWTQFLDPSGNIYMRVSSVDRLTRIGDVFSGSGNATQTDVDDVQQKFIFRTGGTDRFIAYKDWTFIGGAVVHGSIQTYNGTGSVTIADNVSTLQYDPSSVNATATITLPASSGGTGSILTVVFGGNVPSTGAVVTTLSWAPGSGNTIVASSLPTTANSGDSVSFQKIGNYWYQIH